MDETVSELAARGIAAGPPTSPASPSDLEETGLDIPWFSYPRSFLWVVLAPGVEDPGRSHDVEPERAGGGEGCLGDRR